MTVRDGIFGDTSNFEARFVPDFDQLGRISESLKQAGLKIVLTSGSFDLIHMGHALYLEKAKGFGSCLIVGVDSDEKIRKRKGPDRPIVPEEERLMMLTHLRPVDLVTVKPVENERWSLIKAVRPDVLVATAETYTDAQIAELENGLCGRVEVLEPMATTTTTARLRLLQINFKSKLADSLKQAIPTLVQQLLDDQVGE